MSEKKYNEAATAKLKNWLERKVASTYRYKNASNPASPTYQELISLLENGADPTTTVIYTHGFRDDALHFAVKDRHAGAFSAILESNYPIYDGKPSNFLSLGYVLNSFSGDNCLDRKITAIFLRAVRRAFKDAPHTAHLLLDVEKDKQITWYKRRNKLLNGFLALAFTPEANDQPVQWSKLSQDETSLEVAVRLMYAGGTDKAPTSSP
ncbi:MAG: hypothetical protein H6867_10300 [Rhodospirillales bacterium]|nr:hypothetical protein [Rhodospirillales bacterium]MCB9995825.1 hypothetical protein [Rhodospirillales bacterium]